MPETPLDPKFKGANGYNFHLDQTKIAGRKRTRAANIPEGGLDFLSLNERGELVIAGIDQVIELLKDIKTGNEKLLKELLRLR